jgi:hypothetical protein
MRVLVNQPLVEKRSSWGRRIMSVGFGAMILAVALSTQRQAILAAYGMLMIGLALINTGAFVGGKWMRRPRPDEILDKALKGLNHGTRLYNYLLPADHVLLCAVGLFVLTLKFQDGKITGQGDKWRRRLSLLGSLRALFESGLGNPGRQARREAARVQKWLHEQLPEAEVTVRPLIVFANPKAELRLEEPSVLAFALADLKRYLRTALKDNPLPRATLQALTDLCDEQAA